MTSEKFLLVLHEDVLRNFTNFTPKQLCWTLFSDKVASSRPASRQIKTPIKIFSPEVCEILEIPRRKRIVFRKKYFYQSLRSRFEDKLKFGRLRHQTLSIS